MVCYIGMLSKRQKIIWKKPTFWYYRCWHLMQCGGLEWIDGPLHKHSKDDSRQAIGGLKLEIPLWMIDWWGSNGPPQNFGASFCPPSLTAMWKASMLELCGHGWVLLRVLIWRLHQVSSQDHHQKKNLAMTSIFLFSFFFCFPQHLFALMSASNNDMNLY